MTLIKPHILLVEDDLELAEWMQDYLNSKGFECILCHRGDEAVRLIESHNPDIVILDGMLPGLDGFDVCKAVRPEFSNAIIMVTARDEEIDEVVGLEVGADDYLTKPIRARALLTRIRKFLDRQTNNGQAKEGAPQYLAFDNLIIDKQAMRVTLNEATVNISSNEFEVLWLLASQAGELVTREELVHQIRGFDYDGFDRSIDLRISRLRKKLGDDSANPFRIKTVWGKGYLFASDCWS